MHIHILGVCGTFMGGVAALARAAGHEVTGSDRNVYPPMSDQLAALGIRIIEGYEPDQLRLNPDMVVVGNVMSRGNALIEALLESDIPYTSGPQWLAQHVLAGRWTLAVAGTHGKTTTSSILAWILEYAGLDPGFLIGGVPGNFDRTARLGSGRCFVVEADEYDTAFFDKRAKFVHYRPRTVVLNNLEHDHADIYPDVASIQRQFHLLLRMVPRNGLVVANGADEHLAQAIAMGCWTPIERFAAVPPIEPHALVQPIERDALVQSSERFGSGAIGSFWRAQAAPHGDYSSFVVLEGDRPVAEVQWPMAGRHNAENALAAMLAARHAGVELQTAARALREFQGVKRRMELRGVVDDVSVYDDFAHHPTAVEATIDALRRRIGAARLIAVLEPRSNTMKLGTHRDALARSLMQADRVWLHQSAGVDWDVAGAVASLGERACVLRDIDDLVAQLGAELAPGDHVLIMSNGGFGGIHAKLLDRLRARAASAATG